MASVQMARSHDYPSWSRRFTSTSLHPVGQRVVSLGFPLTDRGATLPIYPSRIYVVFLRLAYHRLLLSPCVWVSFSPLLNRGRIGRTFTNSLQRFCSHHRTRCRRGADSQWMVTRRVGDRVAEKSIPQ